MNKETIEKAADLYAAKAPESYTNGDFGRYAIADAFEAGALWRINSVWHDGTVSCQPRRKALVLFKNGNATVYNDLRDLTFERMWGEVDKFAYIDELLPEGKDDGR